MSWFESVPVPFIEIDGKKALTATQLLDNPYLKTFVECFRTCFRHDIVLDVYFYEPPHEDEVDVPARQD